MMSAAVAGTTFRPIASYTTPRDVTLGDVMLGRGVAQRLNGSAAPVIWGESLLALTASLDLVIANLECCLASGGRPTRRIPRKPFFFRGPRSATA
jgi:hypothetical protein